MGLASTLGGTMHAMIWSGAAITLLGVAGLIYCVLKAAQARKAGLSGDAMKAQLQKLVALNFAALGISAIGLGLVVVGILLG